jgi:hypothetical protein
MATDFIRIPTWQEDRRFRTIPLPQKLKTQFKSSCERWFSHSGPEWTVSRLKAFKDCLVQSWAQGKSLTCKPEWFATTSSGNLAGVFGSLFKVAMSSDDNLKAVLMLTNWYTIIRRKSTTKEIEDEIRKEITSNPVAMGKLSKKVYPICKRIGISRVKAGKPIPLLQVLPGKRSHVQRIPEDLSLLLDSHVVHRHLKIVQQAIGATWAGPDLTNPTLEEWDYYQQMGLMNPYFIVGQIDVTHEPGLKTRYFASPSVVLQRALEPLKEALMHSLKEVPWDCTLNQRKADHTIQAMLKKGSMVYSIDLHSATDHFP